MAGVFTACSLTGSLWDQPDADPYAAVVGPAEVFLAAAGTAGVRRVVVCSPAAVGAADDPANRHLAAKAEVERMVAASGLEHAILRCTHVLGRGARLLDLLANGEPVPVPGSGRQLVAPVWVGDVASAIAAADDAVELRATWSLAGPTELALDALVDAVHGTYRGAVAKRHLDGATSGPDVGLTPAQLGLLATDSLPDPALPQPPGVPSTSLAETLARSTGQG
jgi:uncharacterized protein YbjT (DUF2867 family)